MVTETKKRILRDGEVGYRQIDVPSIDLNKSRRAAQNAMDAMYGNGVSTAYSAGVCKVCQEELRLGTRQTHPDKS